MYILILWFNYFYEVIGKTVDDFSVRACNLWITVPWWIYFLYPLSELLADLCNRGHLQHYIILE